MLEVNEIYNMDCVEGMKMLDDGCIDLTVTSSPYDNLRTYDNGIDKTWCEEKWRSVILELYRVTKQGGVCVWIVNDATINGSESGTSFRQALFFMESGFKLYDTMIWNKPPRGAVGNNRGYWQSFEYMFVFSKGTPHVINLIKDRENKESRKGDSGTKRKKDGSLVSVKRKGYSKYGRRTNVWTYNIGCGHTTSDRINWHPAMFPEQLAEDHIRTWSDEGGVVLDPFIGSGTTGVACVHNRRNYIGFEKNEKYWELASKRLKTEKFNMVGKLF